MGNLNSESRVWRVKGYLDGDYLTDAPWQLGDCTLHKEGNKCSIVTVVEADNSSVAEQNAKARFNDACLALSWATRSGYRYEIQQYEEITPTRKVRGAGACQSIYGRGSAILSEEQRREAEALINMLGTLGESNQRIQVALELYRISFFETNDRSRFLTYVSILEALAPNREKIEDLNKVLPDIKRFAKSVTCSLPPEKRQQFLSGLGKLKLESITDTIKRLVGQVNQMLAERAGKLYGVRSSMTHPKKRVAPEDIEQMTAEIESIVARVLRYELSKYLT